MEGQAPACPRLRVGVRWPIHRTPFLETVAETPLIRRAWRTMPLQRWRILLFHDTYGSNERCRWIRPSIPPRGMRRRVEGQAPACPRRSGRRPPSLESNTHPGHHHRNPAHSTGMEDHAPPALTRSPFPRHRWFYRATLMDPPIDTSPWHEAARGGASSRLPAKVGKTSAVPRIEHPSWTSSPKPRSSDGHGGPCPSSADAPFGGRNRFAGDFGPCADRGQAGACPSTGHLGTPHGFLESGR